MLNALKIFPLGNCLDLRRVYLDAVIEDLGAERAGFGGMKLAVLDINDIESLPRTL